jgi:Methyltransferase FkbM domain
LNREIRFAKLVAFGRSEPGALDVALELRSGRTFGSRLLRPFPRAIRTRPLPRTAAGTTSLDSGQFVRFCVDHYRDSRAQIFQDLLVLFVLGEQRDGYAVEFGVADGVTRSNTLLLEERGWRTLLSEPARGAQASVKAHRRGELDTRCVWLRSGEWLEFVETANPELSTIRDYAAADGHASERTDGTRYLVETVSLGDLLRSHDAPRSIDYLSVDTEGSEFDILSHFDFGEYDIKVITVEHNHVVEHQQRLYELLTSRGFVRVLAHLSGFDDWYVHRDVLAARGAN